MQRWDPENRERIDTLFRQPAQLVMYMTKKVCKHRGTCITSHRLEPFRLEPDIKPHLTATLFRWLAPHARAGAVQKQKQCAM